MAWHFGYDIAVAVLTTPTTAFKPTNNSVCIYLDSISGCSFEQNGMVAYGGSKVPEIFKYKSIFPDGKNLGAGSMFYGQDKNSRGFVMQHDFNTTVPGMSGAPVMVNMASSSMDSLAVYPTSAQCCCCWSGVLYK